MNHHEDMDMTLGKLIAARLFPHTRLTQKELADRMGRSASYVSQLVNGQKAEMPPPDVVAAISRELGIPVATQLRAWGYDLPEQPRPTHGDPRLQTIADHWPDLTEKEREFLLHIVSASILRRSVNERDDDLGMVTGPSGARSTG